MEVRLRPYCASNVRIAGSLLVALGVSVLVGWVANIGVLMSVLPGYIAMKPDTAICFLCAGVCIVLLADPSPTRKSRIFSAALAAVILGAALLTVIEYSFHVSLGLDQ